MYVIRLNAPKDVNNKQSPAIELESDHVRLCRCYSQEIYPRLELVRVIFLVYTYGPTASDAIFSLSLRTCD